MEWFLLKSVYTEKRRDGGGYSREILRHTGDEEKQNLTG